jgi:hypothetical protein
MITIKNNLYKKRPSYMIFLLFMFIFNLMISYQIFPYFLQKLKNEYLLEIFKNK